MTERATVVVPKHLAGLVRAAMMATRWASLKGRILALRSEREECEFEDEDGVFCRDLTEKAPPPQDDPFGAGGDPLPLAKWCGACQRNDARYRLRIWLQGKLRGHQTRMVRGLA